MVYWHGAAFRGAAFRTTVDTESVTPVSVGRGGQANAEGGHPDGPADGQLVLDSPKGKRRGMCCTPRAERRKAARIKTKACIRRCRRGINVSIRSALAGGRLCRTAEGCAFRIARPGLRVPMLRQLVVGYDSLVAMSSLGFLYSLDTEPAVVWP